VGRVLATKIPPELTGRLDAPGCSILDAGTGLAAIAVTLAWEFPRAHAGGIGALDRALDLARAELASAGEVAGRVSLRQLDTAGLASYDLVWLPALFLADAALSAALPRVINALVPGGWIVVATIRRRASFSALASSGVSWPVFSGLAGQSCPLLSGQTVSSDSIRLRWWRARARFDLPRSRTR
jgi:hypothetical protein